MSNINKIRVWASTSDKMRLESNVRPFFSTSVATFDNFMEFSKIDIKYFSYKMTSIRNARIRIARYGVEWLLGITYFKVIIKNKIYYYFVENVFWNNEETIEYDLVLDSFNTYRQYIKPRMSRIFIERQLVDRNNEALVLSYSLVKDPMLDEPKLKIANKKLKMIRKNDSDFMTLYRYGIFTPTNDSIRSNPNFRNYIGLGGSYLMKDYIYNKEPKDMSSYEVLEEYASPIDYRVDLERFIQKSDILNIYYFIVARTNKDNVSSQIIFELNSGEVVVFKNYKNGADMPPEYHKHLYSGSISNNISSDYNSMRKYVFRDSFKDELPDYNIKVEEDNRNKISSNSDTLEFYTSIFEDDTVYSRSSLNEPMLHSSYIQEYKILSWTGDFVTLKPELVKSKLIDKKVSLSIINTLNLTEVSTLIRPNEGVINLDPSLASYFPIKNQIPLIHITNTEEKWLRQNESRYYQQKLAIEKNLAVGAVSNITGIIGGILTQNPSGIINSGLGLLKNGVSASNALGMLEAKREDLTREMNEIKASETSFYTLYPRYRNHKLSSEYNSNGLCVVSMSTDPITRDKYDEFWRRYGYYINRYIDISEDFHELDISTIFNYFKTVRAYDYIIGEDVPDVCIREIVNMMDNGIYLWNIGYFGDTWADFTINNEEK